MAKQLKLTQVIGKRLDPNCKYVFMFDGNTTPYGQIEHFRNEMNRLMGNNFAVTLTNGNPKKSFEVFEINKDADFKNIAIVPEDKEAAPRPQVFRRQSTQTSQIQPSFPNPLDLPPPGVNDELAENEA